MGKSIFFERHEGNSGATILAVNGAFLSVRHSGMQQINGDMGGLLIPVIASPRFPGPTAAFSSILGVCRFWCYS